jgi:hypothetical protein
MHFGNKVLEYSQFGKHGHAIKVTGAYDRGYGDNVRFNVRSIDLLENLKGKLIKNLVIALNDDDLANVDFLKQYLGAPGDNCCQLYFSMRDHVGGHRVMLRSKRLIAVDKRLIETLKDSGIKFRINARI